MEKVVSKSLKQVGFYNTKAIGGSKETCDSEINVIALV